MVYKEGELREELGRETRQPGRERETKYAQRISDQGPATYSGSFGRILIQVYPRLTVVTLHFIFTSLARFSKRKGKSLIINIRMPNKKCISLWGDLPYPAV